MLVVFVTQFVIVASRPDKWPPASPPLVQVSSWSSAANRLIGEVEQSRRRPLLGPSPS